MQPKTVAAMASGRRTILGAGALRLPVLGLLLLACTAEDRNGGNPPPPNLSQLILNPTSVGFQFTPGGAAPAPQAIGLNGTAGSVTALVIGTILYSPISSGWLAADFSSALPETPNNLVLTASPPADLLPGTYVASVPIGSTVTGVTTQYMIATLTVDSIPAIDASPSSVSIAVQQGGANPAPQFVNIDNAGSGTLSGLSIGTVSYDSAASGWLAASLNQTTAPATLTIQATTGTLAAGTYVAQVPVRSSIAGVAPDTITVSLGVSAIATPPTIVLSPTVRSVSAVQGGANPSPQNVGVSNGGGGTLGGLSMGATTYGAGANGWLTVSISQATAPALVIAQAATGVLVPGTYTATVAVVSSQAGVTQKTFQVNFTVSAAVTPPKVNLAPAAPSFSANVGGASPTPIAVAVTNGGGGTLGSLSLGATQYGAGATGWLAAALSNTTAPATITLTPTVGALAVGTYTATIPVNSGVPGAITDTLQITLQVFGLPVPPAIGLAPTSVSLAATVGGANPAARVVSVTNSGAGVLTGLGVGTITYGSGGSGWLSATLNQTTAPANLTLQATTGALTARTYTATVPVTSGVASNSPRNVTVTFTVSSAPSLVLSPTSQTFTGTTGQPNPTPKTVNVTNGGAGTLTGLTAGPVSYGAGQPTGWLTTSLSTTTSPSTLILTPVTGALTAGSYTATVPVATTTAGVASQSVAVTFLVGAPSGSISKLQGDNQSGLVNSTLPVTLKARIFDQAGNPSVGTSVVWQVNNGGTLSSVVSTSNSIGEVSAIWKVGPLAGIHTVVLSAAGLPSVTFQADVLLPSNPGSHPNEPAGFVAFAENNFSILPATTRTANSIQGLWYRAANYAPANLTVITPDLTAPESQPNVLRTVYPTGFVAGRGPVYVEGWDGTLSAQKSKLYVSVWIKIADSVFEAAPAVTKLGFIGYGQASSIGVNQGFFYIPNGLPPTIASRFKLGFIQQNHVSRGIPQNVNATALMTCNVWHQWEAVLELNTLGQANGILKMWIDGIKILDYSDMVYITNGNTNKFTRYTWNPTWGGLGATKTRTDKIDLDHVYLSGVP